MIRTFIFIFFVCISVVLANDNIESLYSKCFDNVDGGSFTSNNDVERCTTDKGAEIEFVRSGRNFYCITYVKKNKRSQPRTSEIEFTTRSLFYSKYLGARNNTNVPENSLHFTTLEGTRQRAKFAFLARDRNFDITSFKIDRVEQTCRDQNTNSIFPNGEEVVRTTTAAPVQDEYETSEAYQQITSPNTPTTPAPAVVKFKEHCGKIKSRENVFIYETDLAAPGKYPWFVAITRSSAREEKKVYKCAGTIINEKHILTLASCVFEGNTELRPRDLSVQVSPLTLSSLLKSELSKQSIEKIDVHPQFDIRDPNNNNIAIIKLKHELVYSDYVQPVCMPHNMFNVITGSNAKVLGYGNINQEKIREVPRILDFEVDTQKSQYQFYASMTRSEDNGIDIEYLPDLGSGIFLRDNRYWRIIGMVQSKSKQSDKNFKTDSTGFVLTNLEAHKDWIERTAGMPLSSNNNDN